jgi:hypothetical protein
MRVLFCYGAAVYLLTGIATAAPIVMALSWASLGAGTTPTEYISLFGSLVLVASALISLFDGRSAARLALVGTVALWSFYLPAAVGVFRIRLSDQELGLSVLLWTPSDSPLRIRQPSPNIKLSSSEIRQIEDSGITGTLSTYAADGRYGSGKQSHVILIMQGPVKARIELKEPDASNIVYVQYGENWKMFPPKTRTLKRTIRIEPEWDDPKQSMVRVELADGATQGFGVWWPKMNSENPGR